MVSETKCRRRIRTLVLRVMGPVSYRCYILPHCRPKAAKKLKGSIITTVSVNQQQDYDLLLLYEIVVYL